MARTTTKAPPAGLTPEEAALLEELTAKAAAAADPTRRELTARERVYARGLRERDHLEGCPGSHPDGTPRVEAYVETATAPSRRLQDVGVRAGDRLVVLRCVDCAGTAYKTVDPQAANPLDEYVRAELARAAGTADDAELDGTL